MACGTNNVNAEVIIYDSDTDPSITNHSISNPFPTSSIPFNNTISGIDFPLHQIVFEATANTGYNNEELIIDDVVLNTNYFFGVSSSTSDFSGDTIVIAASEQVAYLRHLGKGENVQKFSILRNWNSGASWQNMVNVDNTNFNVSPDHYFNLWAVTYDQMQVSSINTKRVFFTGLECHLIDADTYTPGSNTTAFGYNYHPGIPNTHTDVRHILALRSYNNSDQEEVFVGHDGGTAKVVVDHTQPFSGTGSPTWVANYGNDNCSGSDCGPSNQLACNLSFGIGTSLKSRFSLLSLQDNGILGSFGSMYKWRHHSVGDAWFVKFFKRQGEELRFLYNDNYGLLRLRSMNPSNGNLIVGTQNLEEVDGPVKYRPKTTFAGEFSAHVDIYQINLSATNMFANLTSSNSTWINAGVTDVNNKKRVVILAPDLNSNDRIGGYACDRHTISPQGDIFITVDGGSNWHTYSNPTNKGIVSMYMDSKLLSNGHTRLGGGSAGYDGTTGGVGQDRCFEFVYNPTNHTWSWTNITTGLPDGPVNVLEFDDRSRILYAGTDFGIYYLDVDATTREWKCFSKNLSNFFVYDLDINYCTGKIYAAAFGRGGYVSDLQPNPRWNDQNDGYSTEKIFNASTHETTWNSSRSVFKTVIIPNGEKLKITGAGSTSKVRISFGAKTHIIVEPGGSLILENAILTNDCGAMWGGIVVKGNPNSIQNLNSGIDFANQGFVRLKPGTEIENAITGINASNISYANTGSNTWAPAYASGGEGGIVKALGTSTSNRDVIFRNCANAVNFFAYQKANISSFENCLFVADANLLDDHYIDYKNPSGPARYGTHTFVNNWACGDIKFTNCTFQTDLSSPSTFNPRVDLRGRAYTSSDGGAIFDGCTFENVSRGLMCNNVYSFRKPVAKNCTFTNVWRSASFRSINNPEFMNNTVTVGSQAQFAQYDMNSDI
ncbi:MAG TPA: hypothetical protein PL009_14625, partial [Flavipsychrobacter sp.]|nr:hypothetical protein [Flavipsychrobacter sp.]